jgi:hypothetical protein
MTTMIRDSGEMAQGKRRRGLHNRVRETSGRSGAVLTSTRLSFSSGFIADVGFEGPGVLRPPHVDASGTLVYQALASKGREPEAQVTSVVTFTDDAGRAGTVAPVTATISSVPTPESCVGAGPLTPSQIEAAIARGKTAACLRLASSATRTAATCAAARKTKAALALT